MRLRPGATPIDLELRAGELVGLAGLEGHGQEAFLRALRGFPPAGGGTVARVDAAEPVVLDGPAVARRHGIGYVPRERRNEALFEQLSIRENFGLPTMREDTVAGVIRPARTDRRLARHAGPLHLKMRQAGDPVTTLSGGNQQKVVIARALADRPGVLLLNDPTRGIDVSAKHDLYDVLQDLCAAGTSVVLLSTEVDELVEPRRPCARVPGPAGRRSDPARPTDPLGHRLGLLRPGGDAGSHPADRRSAGCRRTRNSRRLKRAPRPAAR